jgi:hypothetical protein
MLELKIFNILYKVRASAGASGGGRKGPLVLAERVGVVTTEDEALTNHPLEEGSGIG